MDVESEVVAESGQLRAEIFRLESGQEVRWQRCTVADRVIAVTDGGGYCFRSHGRDESRDEIGPGDVIHVRRMLWHRLLATAEEGLSVTVVTAMPAQVEFRKE